MFRQQVGRVDAGYSQFKRPRKVGRVELTAKVDAARVRPKLHQDGSILTKRLFPVTIQDWLKRVDAERELTCVPMNKEQRTGPLKLLEELVHRLRVPRELATKQVSEAAVAHGKIRRSQGYSVSMIVEESRILQVSIFHTLEKNQSTKDFNLLLADVMTIADECDSQLKQTINNFMRQASQIAA
jgi:hypothetical protein